MPLAALDTTSWSALEDYYVHFTPPPQRRGKGGNTGTADEGTPEEEEA